MNSKKGKTFLDKIEQPFLYLTLGAIFPILFFLTGWWGSYLILPERFIPAFALTGLAFGILLDLRQRLPCVLDENVVDEPLHPYDLPRLYLYVGHLALGPAQWLVDHYP